MLSSDSQTPVIRKKGSPLEERIPHKKETLLNNGGG